MNFMALKKMRNILNSILILRFILSPLGGSTRKKFIAFGKGVGKTGVFPWRKVGKPSGFTGANLICDGGGWIVLKILK